MQIKPVDQEFYQNHLADFLPPHLIDVHTHIWLKAFEIPGPPLERGAQWAGKVAAANTPEAMNHEYQQMLPLQKVTPVVFGLPGRQVDIEANNRWVTEKARQYHLPSLLISRPETPAVELVQQVTQGGFKGLKPYLDFAPVQIKSNDVTIYDFLPPAQLEAADANAWVVLLHIPRGGRLKDPVNLAQMLEIEQKYPNLKLIIAHIGRAYCPADLGNAFEVLQRSERMLFDFSANTNMEVMAALIRAVGSRRILYGSDLPITHMRMRRICENGTYINLVPPGIYADLSDDPHMREVSPEEGEKLSFFLYEELLAFRKAAEINNLASSDIEAVFYRNARRIFGLSEG